MLKILAFIRSLFMVVFIVLHTLWCSVVVITLLVLHAPRKFADFFIGPVWCGVMVWLSGIRPVVEGRENVPRDEGFLYLFTHSSHMDIPVLFWVSPKSFRFGSKASLFKIPIFGYAIKLSGTLPITRENREKVMKVYEEAEARVAKGEAFALAPEGGRRYGDQIKDFKSGPFIFAINAKMPLVPVVMCGIDRALPKGSILVNKDRWTQKIGVRFLPPIPTENVPIEDVKILKEKVRDQMVTAFEEMKKNYL